MPKRSDSHAFCAARRAARLHAHRDPRGPRDPRDRRGPGRARDRRRRSRKRRARSEALCRRARARRRARPVARRNARRLRGRRRGGSGGAPPTAAAGSRSPTTMCSARTLPCGIIVTPLSSAASVCRERDRAVPADGPQRALHVRITVRRARVLAGDPLNRVAVSGNGVRPA